MSFKIREEHINLFADFMEEHLEFARGRLSCSNAREQFKKLWSELSSHLNSLGYGVRTIDKWQRTWSDYKLNLKKRASEVKKEETGTGGGPPILTKLCETDCRILNILGKTFYQGCGVKEQELARIEKQNTQCIKGEVKGHTSTSTNSNNITATNNSAITTSVDENWSNINTSSTILAEKKTSANQGTNANISLPSTSSNYGVKRKTADSVYDDHDYLGTPRFPKKFKKRSSTNENQTINTYYEETINLLRNIEQNTKNMNENLANINSTIDKKISELCEILSKK